MFILKILLLNYNFFFLCYKILRLLDINKYFMDKNILIKNFSQNYM